MVAVCPDGFIAFVFGLYSAKANDATILEDCFLRFPDKLGTLKENDIMVADRGFRDVVNLMEAFGLTMLTPKGVGPSQVEDLVANANRFVTMVRWIVESTFGRLKKKFRFLALPAHNGALQHDFELVLIGFTLMNMFFEPIYSHLAHQPEVILTMKARKNMPNQLKLVVEHYRLKSRRVIFNGVNVNELSDDQLVPLNETNAAAIGFPSLNMDDLYMISCGPYQLKNACGYYADHVANHEGIFQVLRFNPSTSDSFRINYTSFNISVQRPVLFKAKLASRFRSGQHWYQFVLVDNAKSGRDAIVEYYCTCASGSRTVGCCSHIMCIIWYLGYAHSRPITIPNPGILDITLKITR